MGKKPGKTEQPQLQCSGGRSWGCQHKEHPQGREIFCPTCKTYMGCNRCCQIPQEILCLKCEQPALNNGKEEHGKIPSRKNGINLFKKLIEELKIPLDAPPF